MYGLRRENRFAPFRPHTMVAHLIRLDARSRFMVDGEMGGDPEPPRDSGKPPQCLSGPGACRASDGRAANPSARSTIRRFWIHGAAMGLHIPENFSSLSRIFASTTKARQAPRHRACSGSPALAPMLGSEHCVLQSLWREDRRSCASNIRRGQRASSGAAHE